MMIIEYLEVKRAYYNDPENVVLQYQMDNGLWYDWKPRPPIDPPWDHCQYVNWRVKPKTIRIGAIDVPEPVREELKFGQTYFVPELDGRIEAYSHTWNGGDYDLRVLKRGFIHLENESAICHAQAIILASGGKI